jgi:hypothetical protein
MAAGDLTDASTRLKQERSDAQLVAVGAGGARAVRRSQGLEP